MSDEVYRTFIGVEIGATARTYLAELQEKLKQFPGRLKWTDMTGTHITLTFLGDTAVEKIDLLAPKIQQVCDKFIPFSLYLNETGVFPHANNPRVFWVGLDDESMGLSGLKQGIDEIAVKAGFEVDRRHFVPHITLGRVKFLKPASELLHNLLSTELPSIEWQVQSVNWYRSNLKPSGAEYTILKKFELNNGGSA